MTYNWHTIVSDKFVIPRNGNSHILNSYLCYFLNRFLFLPFYPGFDTILGISGTSVVSFEKTYYTGRSFPIALHDTSSYSYIQFNSFVENHEALLVCFISLVKIYMNIYEYNSLMALPRKKMEDTNKSKKIIILKTDLHKMKSYSYSFLIS